MKEVILENVEQMRAWATDFAKTLSAPIVVALHGDLGMVTDKDVVIAISSDFAWGRYCCPQSNIHNCAIV